jgi:hypothetical protein
VFPQIKDPFEKFRNMQSLETNHSPKSPAMLKRRIRSLAKPEQKIQA